MSVDQEIYIEGTGSFINQISPDINPTTLSNIWVTSGIDGSDRADFIVDVEIFCDPGDRFGTVSYPSPRTGEKKTHVLIDNNKVEFGIRLDDGRSGTISWKHVPTGPEMGVLYKSRKG
jgi:hypothetical protein